MAGTQSGVDGRDVLVGDAWNAKLTQTVETDGGVAADVAAHYADQFSESYKEDFTPANAIEDIERIEALVPGRVDVAWRLDPYREGQWRFMMYTAGEGVVLSEVLPALQSLGVGVIFQRPYPVVRPDGTRCWVYAFAIMVVPDLRDRPEITPDSEVGQRFIDTFRAVWAGRAETDRFNELVMRAGLHWREAMLLRAYSLYLRQIGFSYSQHHVQSVLCGHEQIVTDLVELFTARFDPRQADAAREEELVARLDEDLAEVAGIDADRILRAFVHLIRGTVRTNFYVRDEDEMALPQLSFKLAASTITELPEPRPLYEIYVYSPRVEGVHLRFGTVARGGLRWSDRLDDYRTEVLGLAKAQAVKNAVIVPMGAKGGFVVKQPPVPTGDRAADRDAHRAEGVRCYQWFIAGMLDVTDNLDPRTGEVVPPRQVVRHDGDDTYLVVAADKGTAAFSDIANEVSERYGFWLADAFASGGSTGYDHKAMGITARGAWESVLRHFRELGIDPTVDDFTAVGVGDMSGDVFGNGMRRSEHTRLIAAFDHRHIFVDPNPDAARSFVERQRLYDLPGSSWADYDPELISEGGGVWDRSLKSIPVSPQMRQALGLAEDTEELSAPELMQAVIAAPVDLFWNGGIGTYIKASGETDAEVGDKANDSVRVDARDVRTRVIGEGGNLGVTQRGRIEFAQIGGPDGTGGKINTDAIDNSAGVESSDLEVNIKILLEKAISDGALERDDRTELLASMTDEVADLVLTDNRSQNRTLGKERARAHALLRIYERMVQSLELEHDLNREIEALPSAEEFDRRAEAGEPLTSPELAVLLAHAKLAAKSDLLAGDALDAQAVVDQLAGYFPTPLRERFPAQIAEHPLRREIIATVLTNRMVDGGGITYVHRLAELAGANADDALRAFTITTSIFGLPELWRRIDEANLPAAVADELVLETRRLLDRTSRWLLANRPQPLQVDAEIVHFRELLSRLDPVLPDALIGTARERYDESIEQAVAYGTPRELAEQVFILLDKFALLDISAIVETSGRTADDVARLYFALADYLDIDDVMSAVTRLERGDRWHALARMTIREDLYTAMRALCLDVLESSTAGAPAAEAIAEWEQSNVTRLTRSRSALAEIMEMGLQDLATLSVAARQFRSMVHASSGENSGH